MDFAVPADQRVKRKESEKKDKYSDLAREQKKLWSMKVTVIPIVTAAFGSVTKIIGTGTRRIENKNTSEDHPNYSIVLIDHDIEESPVNLGDLLSLRLQWKTIC